LPGGDFKGAAERLTQAGYPTTEDDFKNAGRAPKGGPTPEHAIPADASGIPEFIDAVSSIWPSFEWCRLVSQKPSCESLRIGAPEPKQRRFGGS
jgi:hypothetical protein